MQKSSRRKFLFGSIGIFGAGILSAWTYRNTILKKLFMTGKFDTQLLNTAPNIAEDICVLTSRQVEGPFFFPSPERQDIREDRKGQDLSLKFQILRQPDCTPIENAVVEIWHCDAEGVYSGYPEEISHDMWETAMLLGQKGKERNGEIHVDPINDNRFLRGRQKSDKEGMVVFDTILPGWYEGRIPHIHVKINTDKKEELLTQFYFEQQLCDEIYTSQVPYNKYGKCPQKTETDLVLAGGESADGLLLKITPDSNKIGALAGSAKIGIQMA